MLRLEKFITLYIIYDKKVQLTGCFQILQVLPLFCRSQYGTTPITIRDYYIQILNYCRAGKMDFHQHLPF